MLPFFFHNSPFFTFLGLDGGGLFLAFLSWQCGDPLLSPMLNKVFPQALSPFLLVSEWVDFSPFLFFFFRRATSSPYVCANPFSFPMGQRQPVLLKVGIATFFFYARQPPRKPFFFFEDAISHLLLFHFPMEAPRPSPGIGPLFLTGDFSFLLFDVGVCIKIFSRGEVSPLFLGDEEEILLLFLDAVSPTLFF